MHKSRLTRPRNIAAALLVLAGATMSSAYSTVLISDSFPTNGALVGTTPDTGGIWTSTGGTSGDLVVSSNRLVIQDDNTEGASSSFASSQSVDVYYSFTLSLTASPLDLPSTGGTYFSGLVNSGGTTVARLFAGRPSGTAAGTYRLGLSNNGTGAELFFGTDLNPGTNYKIVVKLSLNNSGNLDFTTLWINPTLETDPSITTTSANFAAAINGFAFRQASNSGDFTLDNLIVATTFAEVAVPEPGTLGFLLVGLCFMWLRAPRLRRTLLS